MAKKLIRKKVEREIAVYVDLHAESLVNIRNVFDTLILKYGGDAKYYPGDNWQTEHVSFIEDETDAEMEKRINHERKQRKNNKEVKMLKEKRERELFKKLSKKYGGK